MDVRQPEAVALVPEERELLELINFHPDLSQTQEEVRCSTAAAARLAKSLLTRKAIPDIRLRYFTDPELNVGGHGKSRKGVFESNGVTGDDILKDPNFLKYFRYFIFGPDLPTETTDRFRQVLIDDAGTSGEVLDQLRRCARAEARRLSHLKTDLREEFFKLALECEVTDHVARSVRDAVRSVR